MRESDRSRGNDMRSDERDSRPAGRGRRAQGPAKWSGIRREARREAKEAVRLATRVWELAEPPFREEQSAKLIADYLAGRGFRVQFPIPSVPTAFRATWGRGRPAIGFLGEYDALPDCGLKKGTWGHACGHNLLGVGSAVGAVVASRMLVRHGLRGAVVYWGCPAEEALAGKVYMARDGAFRGLDACLAWHPSDRTAVNAAGGAALDSLTFEFYGRTAHGAHADRGRSALDAAVLTDVAANYLREHVPDNVRIHCVLPRGGTAPNVVPEYAKAWYYVRGKDREQVEEMTRRLTLCARGAVTATETRLRITRLTGVYSRLTNGLLAETVRDNLVAVGPPHASKADRRRVRQLGRRPEFDTHARRDIPAEAGKASSDEDNVSWLAPLGAFNMACVPKGVSGHHRDYTAQSNLPFAHRAMVRAAQVLAGVAWDLMAEPRLLRRVRRQFSQGTKRFRYDPLVPKGQRPLAQWR